MIVALFGHGAGADEELRAHALSLLHFTPAAVVVVEEQSVHFMLGVVAECVKRDIVIFLSPEKTQVIESFCLSRSA